jgi:hypothetical protein
MATPTLADIREIIRSSKEADSVVCADMRSNVQLYSSEHYTRRLNDVIGNQRGPDAVPKEKTIRITKNHTRRIVNQYINTVTGHGPSATAAPSNENEIRDIKAADINRSVIAHARAKYDLPKKHVGQAQNFFIIGEVGDCIMWDYTKGKMLGYKPKTDENGEMVLDEWGRPEASDEAVFSGAPVIKKIWGWNLIRDRNAESLDESPFLGYEELAQTKELQERYKGQPDKLKFIQGGTSETIRIFEPGNGVYYDEKGQVLVSYIFWRKCQEYPNGWWNLSTKDGILEEGELPEGIFPIVYETCLDRPSSARGQAPIKDWRPYQIEINRATSKQAEHQITVGDDKLVFPNGSSVSQSAQLPGIRTYKSSGPAPVVIPGRTGTQFVEYIESTLREWYHVAMVPELLEDKKDGQSFDPYAQLYKNLRQKKQFSYYADKFERYTVKFYELLLEVLRAYLPDDEVIQMIGKSEAVNIQEFKNQDPLTNQIKIEPISDDLDTQMGKQLAFNHLIQYVGPNLSRNDIGKIVTEMPFLNEGKRIFGDLVIDEENATNLILQLDRGELPRLKPGINKEYTLSRLTARQNKSDYDYLPPEAQMNYDVFIQQVDAAITAEQQSIKALQADFIPAQGMLIGVDFYYPDPVTGKSKRVRLPQDAVSWLIKRLEEQGSSLEKMEQLQVSAQSRLGNQAHQTADPHDMAAAQAQGGANVSQRSTADPGYSSIYN